MAEITAAMVKDLREKTGAGMMDCKSALNETKGDMEAAVDWLRNEQFQAFVAKVAELALDADGDVAKLAKMPFPGSGTDVEGHLKNLVATIGENMSLRRTASFNVSPGVVASYVHNQAAPNLGRLGVLVSLKSSGNAEALAALGRKIAMHVASTNPIALKADQVDAATLEREKAIFAEQARQSGKPENIITKMVEGRVRKFYEEVVLLQQAFIMDPDKTVEAFVKASEKDVGAPISVEGFVRFALGEGIQKEETDFAAEVAAAAKG